MNYTFDGVNKLIVPIDAPVNNEISVSVQDIYSRWVDWMLTSDNSKYLPAMRVVGGDPLPGSKQLGLTYFLLNGWKIRPYEEEHVFLLNGNLYSEDGSSPYVRTVADVNVTIVNSVSNLVDSTVQQLPEIEYSSFNNGVTIDIVNGSNGVEYPHGTTRLPCKTIANALAISMERGFNTLYVIGNVVLSTDDFSYYKNGIIVGSSYLHSSIHVDGVIFDNAVFRNCKLTGNFGDNSHISISTSTIGDVSGASIHASDCYLSGNITLGSLNVSNFSKCIDAIPGSGTPVISIGEATNVGFWSYSGGLKITDITTIGTNISVNFSSGRLIVDESDISGSILVRGVGSINGVTGGTTIISSDLISNTSIIDGVEGTAEVTRAKAIPNFTFPMLNLDGQPEPGLTVTVTRSIDGAAFAPCYNTVTEIASGAYSIDLSSADLDGKTIMLMLSAPGASTHFITLITTG